MFDRFRNWYIISVVTSDNWVAICNRNSCGSNRFHVACMLKIQNKGVDLNDNSSEEGT